MSFKRIDNPPHAFNDVQTEWIDAPPVADLEIFEEHAKTILSENDSPDVGFRFSLNPYRGCFHACAYCYARPTHQYWDFGAGTDFERKIVVKVNAPEKLREAFMKRSWNGDMVVFSGNTDCYQPLEASYRLTRGCLEVCRDFRNPIGIITKSAIVRRDIGVIAELVRTARAHVYFSVAFSDDKMARLIEPGAPSPSTRLAAMKALADAGIPVGVSVAPIIPGLNDSQIAEILERAYECGARRAFRVMLRLPAEVKPVFLERLQQAYPDRAQKVINAVREMRGGELYNSQFHTRGKGSGQRWDAIEWLFDLTCKKLGINVTRERDLHPNPPQPTFQWPGERTLFD